VPPLFSVKEPAGEQAYREEVSAFLKSLKKEADEGRRVLLGSLLAKSQPNWRDRSRVIDRCLHAAADALMGKLAEDTGAVDTVLAPVLELLRRSRLLDAESLHSKLAQWVERAVVEGPPGEPLGLLGQLLFAKEAAIVLELADAAHFEYPANHEAVWAEINCRLLAEAATDGTAASTGADIFGGPVEAGDAKMPERRLPRLGNVKLRSLSADAPCQARYGLAGSSSCPLGAVGQAALAAALDWATRPERDGVTWADVSGSCGLDMPAVLVAYPSHLPPEPPSLSGFLAGPARREAQAEARFEAFAKTVTERLEGIARADPRTVVRVFVLAKADTARTKLLCSRQFAAGRLISAAQEWQEAALNLPPLLVRRFGGAGAPPVWRPPLVPFPAEVVHCLNTAWRREGVEAEQTPGLDFGAGLTLLLDGGPTLRDVAAQGLRQALANALPLLLALGQAHRLGVVHRPRRDSEQALLLPAVLGLLLAKSGSLKGDYMSRNPYLIGRLLSLADQLHLNYCRRERKGQVPPQLLGNSLMPAALDSPVAGLARLSERLPLYYRFAPTELRGEVAEVEQAIDKDGLPERCGDMEKAQMLLGYLARPDLRPDPAADAEQPRPGEEP
jgi:hypothetical protein